LKRGERRGEARKRKEEVKGGGGGGEYVKGRQENWGHIVKYDEKRK
jgi:hypothetical protein